MTSMTPPHTVENDLDRENIRALPWALRREPQMDTNRHEWTLIC
jgi:hypothetical protein